MIAFFCSTPYQVLIAVNIKSQLIDEEADIYILNHFQKAQEVVNRVKDEGVFNNVKLIDCVEFTHSFSKYRIIKFYQKIKYYLYYDKIAEKYFQFDGKKYKQVYFTFPDVIIQLGIRKLYDINPNLKIVLYEDGIGGYNSEILRTTIYKKMFNKVLGFEKVIDRYDNILVFKPELYSSNVSIPIEKIPDIDIYNGKLKKIINSIFDYKSENKIDKKVIFLEQPFVSEELNRNIKKIADEILTITEDYIVKLHPRSSKNLYNKFNLYKNNSVPWEIICLNNEIEEKILISYYSTACFSSKILFDKEPTIVLLFNLKEISDKCSVLNDDNLKFVEKFIKTYRNKSKIFIPNDLDELKTFLNNNCFSNLKYKT